MASQVGNDGVGAVFDALHGNIDLADIHDGSGTQIQKIMSAPFMQRLRRIKQLGFVSQNFLSAQHNRYSHALGTLHIMRKLLQQLDGSSMFENALPAVHKLTDDSSFADTNASGREDAIKRLKQHLLIAAAIQDVGELPYEKATGRIFFPGNNIKGVVRTSGVDVNQFRSKDLFTLFFVWDSEYSHFFDGLDKVLLTFLISGLLARGHGASPEMLALRQLVDGAIDADRLDYVYRDAFHTLGIHHTPDSLINSISNYDHNGPTLRHVRPVTDFLITRAMLWSSVYLSPENRFRIILLRIALRELCKKTRTLPNFIPWTPHETTADNFLSLHDVFVEAVIEKLHREKTDLDGGGADAVKLLQEGARDYEYRWIRVADQPDPDWRGNIDTPAGFYWDTYADYTERDHTLYDIGSVRIEGNRYSRLADPVHLEECMGPFCGMLRTGTWPALPMPKHMAWFAPRSAWTRKGDLWGPLFKFEHARELSIQLEFNDPLRGVVTVFDSRKLDGFSGPDIFVAFAWEDREIVKRALAILYERKRKYYVLLDGGSGFGRSSVVNSEHAVDTAQAILMFGSVAYVDSYGADAGGPIHAEVARMTNRRNDIPIVPLGIDSFEDINKKSFPWSQITGEGRIAFVGSALRHTSTAEFRRHIENALKSIDGTDQQSS